MTLTGAAFFLTFTAGLGLALFRHPIFGLYTYVAVFYLDPPSRWWGYSLPNWRWALIAAIVTLVTSWRSPAPVGRTGWLQTTPARLLIFITAWFWIQNLWALDSDVHLEASILFLKYVLLYYLVYRLVLTPTDVSNFLLVHFVGCAYLGWLAFNSSVSGRLDGVGGPGINEANALAMQLGTAIVAGAMFCLTMPGVRRWLVIAALPFILNGVVLSGSRGGFLALLIAGLALWYLKPRKHRKLFYVLATLGVVLMGILAHDLFWQRMGTMEAALRPDKAEIDNSALSRFALIRAQLQMAEHYPHGTGHRGTAVLSAHYLEERFLSASVNGSERARSSHNTFMTALVEQGLPGALFYVWIWGWTLRATVQLKRFLDSPESAESRAMLAAVAAALALIFVAGMFVDYIKAEVQFWNWALLASIQVATAAKFLPEARKSFYRRAALSTATFGKE